MTDTTTAAPTDARQKNGADTLIETLIDNGVSACFANPGTSEMQFVSALDRQPRMRSVLCLFEGVATGAADGFGRMAGVPACTLLHLGPGYGNGLANLHNARRAETPVVNVVGDHATYHRQYDAPLNSDIPAIVAPNSLWVKSADTPEDVGPLAAEAVRASYGPPGGPVSLILPADSAWGPAKTLGPRVSRPTRAAPEGGQVDAMAKRIRAAAKPVLVLGQACLTEIGLAAAARLAGAGIGVFTDTFLSRQPRGAGRFAPQRIGYFAEQAMDQLSGVDLMVLVATKPPVAFFAYPNRPSLLVPEGAAVETLCGREADGEGALLALAEALGAPAAEIAADLALPGKPSGPLTPGGVGAAISRHLPEGAIVCDDGVTGGGAVSAQSARARPHDWLALTGGAIGIGLPLALGAAVACPDRKVISLNGDGAAMYTIQALWSLAREGADVTAVVFANRVYRILSIELERTGAGNAGPAASRLLGLGDPDVDFTSLAKSMGVPAVRCTTAEDFDAAFETAMAEPGPRLIEAIVP